jgi:eukaryotic-like serine/threonine-protein kinase
VRDLSLEKLRKQLRGDLDNIVLMALRKEPYRRYASVEAFAKDIQRHLDGLPVSARKDTLFYRFSKFTKRNVPTVAAASLLLVVLVAGIALLFWQMHDAKQAQAKMASRIRARRSVAVLGFKNLSRQPETSWLSTALSEMLTTELAAGEQLRAIPQETVAIRKTDLSLPEAESYSADSLAQIRKALGTDVVVLGSYFDSQGQIRLDLRAQDATTGEMIASVSESGTKPRLGDLVSRSGLKLRQRLGVTDVTPAEAQAVAASFPSTPEATRLYAEGLAKLRVLDAQTARDLLAKAVAGDPNHALSHSALSTAWSSLGYERKAAEEAQRAFEQSAALSREHQLLIEGRYREATHQTDRAIDIYRTLFSLFPDNLDYGLRLADVQSRNGKGTDALATVNILRELPGTAIQDPRIDLAEAMSARSVGDYEREGTAAEVALRKAEAAGSRSLVAQAQLAEAVSFRHAKKFKNAIASFEAARQIYAAVRNQRGVGQALNGLGNTLSHEGDLKGARKAFEDALAAYRDIDDKSEAAGVLGNLANEIGDLGDLEGAQKLYEQELATAHEISDRRLVGETLNNMGTILVLRGNLADATNRFRQSLVILRELGDQDFIAQALDSIGTVLLLQGEIVEAKSTFEEELKVRRTAAEEDALAYPLEGLGEAFSATGELPAAQRNLEDSLAITRRNGEQRTAAQALSALGLVAFEKGDLANSRKDYEEALRIRNEAGEKWTEQETRLGLAELALNETQFAEAQTLARQALKESEIEKLRDDQIAAHTILAEVLFAQRKLANARSELSLASRMARTSQNCGVRLATDIASARAQFSSGNPARASRTLLAVLAEAHRQGLARYEYEARLTLGEIELKSGQLQAGRSRLEGVEKEAQGKGFSLIANHAASALAKS